MTTNMRLRGDIVSDIDRMTAELGPDSGSETASADEKLKFQMLQTCRMELKMWDIMNQEQEKASKQLEDLKLQSSELQKAYPEADARSVAYRRERDLALEKQEEETKEKAALQQSYDKAINRNLSCFVCGSRTSADELARNGGAACAECNKAVVCGGCFTTLDLRPRVQIMLPGAFAKPVDLTCQVCRHGMLEDEHTQVAEHVMEQQGILSKSIAKNIGIKKPWFNRLARLKQDRADFKRAYEIVKRPGLPKYSKDVDLQTTSATALAYNNMMTTRNLLENAGSSSAEMRHEIANMRHLQQDMVRVDQKKRRQHVKFSVALGVKECKELNFHSATPESFIALYEEIKQYYSLDADQETNQKLFQDVRDICDEIIYVSRMVHQATINTTTKSLSTLSAAEKQELDYKARQRILLTLREMYRPIIYTSAASTTDKVDRVLFNAYYAPKMQAGEARFVFLEAGGKRQSSTSFNDQDEAKIRKLQSERDKAYNENKRLKDEAGRNGGRGSPSRGNGNTITSTPGRGTSSRTDQSGDQKERNVRRIVSEDEKKEWALTTAGKFMIALFSPVLHGTITSKQRKQEIISEAMRKDKTACYWYWDNYLGACRNCWIAGIFTRDHVYTQCERVGNKFNAICGVCGNEHEEWPRLCPNKGKARRATG
ncbi:unnamed protein product [Amoebophrya sp. A25]|nr:unnamed protein product [Amoebophrya sp. A25]|eukprot:GSA25T00027268001.1